VGHDVGELGTELSDPGLNFLEALATLAVALPGARQHFFLG